MHRWLVVLAIGCKQRAEAPPPPPAPVVLADHESGPSAIAVDDHYVYWHDRGRPRVRRVARDGGPVTTLYNGDVDGGSVSLSLTSDALYFDDTFNVMRIDRAGGSVTVVGHVSQLPVVVAADATGVYAGSQNVDVFPATGGVHKLADDKLVWAIAVDATYVYWMDEKAVIRRPKSGGQGELVARGDFAVASPLVLSETDAYFFDLSQDAIVAVAKSGGKVRTVARMYGGPQALAWGDGALWDVHDGTLDRIDVATGKVTPIMTSLARGGLQHHFGLAVIGGDAYVAAGGEEVTGLDIKNAGDPKAPPPKTVYDGQILKISVRGH